tara:strand:+ start:1536 stop:1685 length:150 start_codon:yes stop_codon:yes gene_type:complete
MKMSSYHCVKCGKRIWDKVDGMSKNCFNYRSGWVHCGFCGYEEPPLEVK